jgi:hypothetical protein
MRVEVTLKAGGGNFTRRENGRRVTYEAGAKFSVSQHVYETFKDRLIPTGHAPEPAPPARSNAAGTDDQPTLLERVVAGLAGVGLRVDPLKAADWTEEQFGKVPKLIERKGKNPPKFVTDSLLPSAPPASSENEGET